MSIIITSHYQIPAKHHQAYISAPALVAWYEKGILLAVVWLLAVGLWSGPAPWATLRYPNGLLLVDAVLLMLLWLQRRHIALPVLSRFPGCWPGWAVLAFCIVIQLLRVSAAFPIPLDTTRLAVISEPMLRGLLLYLVLASRPRLWRPGLIAAACGIMLMAGSAIVQHFTGVSRWYADLEGGWGSGFRLVTGSRAQGLTSYINLTAALLASTIPLAVVPALLRIPQHRVTRGLLFLLGPIILAALWYTEARGPILALGAVSILGLFAASQRLGVMAAVTGAIFVACIAFGRPEISLGALLLGAGGGWWAWHRRIRWLLPVAMGLALAGSLQTIDAYVLHYPLRWRVMEMGLTDSARMDLIHLALHATSESPWWGVGESVLAMRILRIPDLSWLPSTQWNVHNQLLQWSASDGIPVALALTTLLIWTIIRCWRLACSPASLSARALPLAIAMALTTFLLCNIAEAHFWRIEGGGFFWSLTALAIAYPSRLHRR